jgi:isopenicillin-N epimerase
MAGAEHHDTEALNPLWGEDWRSVRDLFELEPGHSHLNHGSFGAVPVPVLQVQAEWRRRMAANSTRFFRRELRPALDDARVATAGFLGADPDGLTLVANVSTGVSAVFGSFPLEPGDEVLMTDHGYQATIMSVVSACAAAGARLVTVPIALDATSDEMTDAVIGAVTDRTRLAVIDHIASATARLFPVERITPALRDRGVAVFIDAAHSPGMMPVDLEALAPDFWVGNLHKWAYAPIGVAALYVTAARRSAMRPLVVSWREPEGYPHSYLQYGTADLTALLAAPTGQDLLVRLGPERVRTHNVKLVEHGHSMLAEALGWDLADLPGDDGVSMRVVPLPVDVSGGFDFQGVVSDTLRIETGVNPWNGRTLLRICANVYNHPGEYERLAERLPSLF